MRGRRLYQAIAEASAVNAAQFLKDAKSLHRRGSLGHACSLSVLAIEESAKAIIYKQAAEGIVRFVAKKPNNVSTYSEKDLKVHRFKHGTVARLILGSLEFGPFHQALAATRKNSFSREDVQAVLLDAHTRQNFQRGELQRGGRARRELDRVFDTLGRLDALKNAGLYVGRGSDSPQLPEEEVRGDFTRVHELAELVVKSADQTVSQKYTPKTRRALTENLQANAAFSRRLHRLAPKQKTGEPVKPTDAAAASAS